MNDVQGEVVVSPPTKQSGGWRPVEGKAFTKMVEGNTSLSTSEKDRLSDETFSILSRCINPADAKDKNTGLVIGYVQSGKTLSFTSLAALASDNKYQLVILLAGTTNNLVEQSFDRLKDDLSVDKGRDWQLFTTQRRGFQDDELARVQSELARWKRGSSKARTILIVSMKQHQHLNALTEQLSNSDLQNVPTLIIDDEGDQAGINTKAKQGEESTTYARISALRNLFPLHSYVLYTATPQAPLLISKIDTLSPDFGKVLTPGERYVGGQEFFVEGTDKYVELIPFSDVPDKNDPPVEPPQSLLDAMRDFFIGVAIGTLEGEDREGRNRSMMIHPAIPKMEHLMFSRWVRQVKENWSEILQDETHPGRDDLIAEFRESADGLLKTYQTEFTFDDIEPELFEVLEDTAIVELNTRQKSRIQPVDWKGEYSWILVGGIGLDRGFTVEGLTVTYMPRSTGVGNADNIQQRARFFGYKKSYLGLCRIYLTSENIDAFTQYVRHEETIRTSVRGHLESGKSLKDWRRTYPLDSSLKPTRSSVIILEMYQSRGRGGWIVPDYPYEDAAILSDNRQIIDEILQKFDFEHYAEDGWNDAQIVPAFSDRVPLSDMLPYLAQFGYHWPDDALQHQSLLLGLEHALQDTPNLAMSVYCLSGPWSGTNAVRSLNEKTPPTIKNLFQGSNARTNYPGARALKSNRNVTLQIHRYDIQTSDKKRTLRDVPVLAIHIPDHLIERVWLER